MNEDKELKEKLSTGFLIDSEFVVGLMEEYMAKSGKKIFLADGFPRNQENIDVWEKVLGKKVDVKFLLLFHVDRDIMLKRL